jgi:hypothetical protein
MRFAILIPLFILLSACNKSVDQQQAAKTTLQPQAKAVRGSTPLQQGTKRPSVHIDDVIGRERQEIIIDLAERLKKHPDIQAYLLPGDSKLVAEDGSRLIIVVHNSAARAIYQQTDPDDLPPFGQAYWDLGVLAIQALNKRLIEDGLAKGYQDEVFYELNWDVGVYGRDDIVALGEQLRATPAN